VRVDRHVKTEEIQTRGHHAVGEQRFAQRRQLEQIHHAAGSRRLCFAYGLGGNPAAVHVQHDTPNRRVAGQAQIGERVAERIDRKADEYRS
jgi:hypothetical protein